MGELADTYNGAVAGPRASGAAAVESIKGGLGSAARGVAMTKHRLPEGLGSSDIQEDAYTELCLENDGLRKALSIAHAEYRELDDKLGQALRRIEGMSLLIARAADALEKHSIAIGGEVRDVITELRKAAE